MEDIRSRGEQRFVDDILAVAEGKPARKIFSLHSDLRA